MHIIVAIPDSLLICNRNHFSKKVVLELVFFSGWRPRKKSKFAEALFSNLKKKTEKKSEFAETLF